MAKIYRYSNKGVLSYNDKDLLKIPVSASGEISTETRHVFLAVYNNLAIKTNEDQANATRLVMAIDEAEGEDYIEIGEGVHDWLKRKLEEPDREGYLVCPKIFTHNGGKVSEFIKDGFEKPHKPKTKKEIKAEEDAKAAEESEESQSEKE